MTDSSAELALTPQHLNRLLKALADSPLLQRHIRKQWWETNRPEDAAIPATPTLTTASPTASWSSMATTSGLSRDNPLQMHRLPSSPTLPSHLLKARSSSDVDEMEPHIPRLRPQSTYQPPPPLIAPPLRSFAPPQCNGVAIVDPSVGGAPVRFVSRDFRLGRTLLRIGSCSFLNMSYGTSVEAQLRVEKTVRGCRIMLQIVSRVVERKTGRRGPLAVVELDVTDSFRRAIVAEYIAYDKQSSRLSQAQKSSKVHRRSWSQPSVEGHIPLHRIRRLSGPTEHVDWCELADEVDTECQVTKAVESVAFSFSVLDTATCTMQVLTLMSELDRLKAQHQDFFIVRASSFHPKQRRGAARIPQALNVPWISQHYDRDRHSRFLPRPGVRSLRDSLVSAVAGRLHAKVPFTARIGEFGPGRNVVTTCVPLIEGRRDDEDDDLESLLSYASSMDDLGNSARAYRNDDERIGAWVCFLSAECCY